MKRPGHTRAFIRTTKFSPAGIEPRLGEVTVPVFLVVGERDIDYPDPTAEARWIGEQLHAESLIVADAGHFPHAEYPEIVNPVLLAFVQQTYSHTPPRFVQR